MQARFRRNEAKSALALTLLIVIVLFSASCAPPPAAVPPSTTTPLPTGEAAAAPSPTVEELQATPTVTAAETVAAPTGEPTAAPGATQTSEQPIPTDQSPVDGRWEGSLSVAGTSLAIVVNFSSEIGTLTGTIDVPAQGATDIPLNNIRFEEPAIYFEMLEGPALAAFDGEIQTSGIISGTFTQAGQQGTFELERAEPVPYQEEEVTFENGDVTLAGTLTLPEGEGPFPAVILITGSGQQNRDEELPMVPGYRPFRVIADHLARNGFAVLRYDDRGIGGSTGDPVEASTVDFAGDTEAALDYLLERPEIDPEQVGLLGHSEGGMITGMVAARRPEVAFVVAMAPVAVTGYDLLLKQIERLAVSSGMTADEVAEALEQQGRVLDLTVAQDWAVLEDYLVQLLLDQIDALPEDQQAELGDPEQVASERAALQLENLQSDWYQTFLTYDIGADWEQVTVPVLALFGDLDVQVDADQNSQALEAALEQAGNQDVTVEVFPQANHLFQEAENGGPQEYATLPPDFIDGFLDTITDWLLERVQLPTG